MRRHLVLQAKENGEGEVNFISHWDMIWSNALEKCPKCEGTTAIKEYLKRKDLMKITCFTCKYSWLERPKDFKAGLHMEKK